MWVDELKKPKDEENKPKGSGGMETPLTPYLETPIQLFIHDQKMLKQCLVCLKRLGFKNLGVLKADPNYFQAMRQLFVALKQTDHLIMVNNPPAKPRGGVRSVYTDLSFGDFFEGVASFFPEGKDDAHRHLSRCLPIFIGPNDPVIREDLIKELMPFGILAAFMLQPETPGTPNDIEIEERTQELFDYYLDYFRERNNKLAQFKEYRSAAELKDRKAEAEKIMKEVKELKAAKDYEKAVALCRRAIAVLPSDPGAYLEGGRILVRKKRFTSAMQMFRDAESVAEAAPEPNQEIGNCRVEQIKEEVRSAKERGIEVDQDKIEQYLAEANENFKAAIKKADTIATFDPDAQEDKRRDAVSGIAENLLTLGLSEVVGEDNPHLLEMMGMARERLEDAAVKGGQIDPKYYIQFGLMAFSKGEYNKAERELFKATEYDETFDRACTKLNYIATQLRKMGSNQRAIHIYKRLIKLEPSFKGYVLLNLATAFMSHSIELEKTDSQEAKYLERDAFSVAAEALYLEPMLPQDTNFYYNSLMAPILERGQKILALAARQLNGDGASSGSNQQTRNACRRARQKLEKLFYQGKQGEAIKVLFELAKRLPAFFLEFDQHCSGPVLEFTEKLHAALTRMDNPRLNKLGKICGILLQKGRAAMAPAEPSGNQQLDELIEALNQNDPASAARGLAWLLYDSPQMIKEPAFAQTRPLKILCNDLNHIISQIDLKRFKLILKPK